MDKNILFTANNSNSIIANLYAEGLKLHFRLFELTSTNLELAEEDFITEEQLNSFDNLLGKPLKHNDSVYWCRFDKTSVLDQTVWQPYKEIYVIVRYTGPYRSDAIAFIDKYAETYISKMNHETYNKRFKVWDSGTLLRMLVLPGTNLETCPKVCTPTQELITNLTFDSTYEYSNVAQEFGDIVTAWKEYWIPRVELTGPDTIEANKYEEFTLKALSQGDQLCKDEVCYYVEPIQGYTPNKEIQMVAGEGKFKVCALGLEAGDKLRFKVNSKYWTDKAEKVLTVI